MNYKIVIFLLLVVCIFGSCEYEFKDENYIKLENPGPSDYYLKIDVPQDENGNYIVTSYSYLTYETNIPRDSISNIEMLIGRSFPEGGFSWAYLINEYSENVFYLDYIGSYCNEIQITISTIERRGDLVASMSKNRFQYVFTFPIVVQ